MEKTSVAPNQIKPEQISKRFSLPQDENIRSRLHQVRAGFQELQSQNPEVVGMTLFGSMVKGTAHQDSDIDSFIFIEGEQFKQRITDEAKQWAEQELTERTSSRYSSPQKSIDLAAQYQYEPVIEATMIAQGLTPEQIKHMRVRVISNDLIEQELTRAINYEKAFAEFMRQSDEWMSGQSSSFDEAPERPELVIIDWKIPALFHVAIGNKLDLYRKHIITTLEEQGDIGEKIWKHIITHTADMERNMQASTYDHLFPTTLKQAKELYVPEQ